MLTIIGDVHGKYDSYIRLLNNKYKKSHTLQVGDMGFVYDKLDNINPKYHKFFGGNHDNYDVYYSIPHQIGDYGNRKHGGINFYFVRGAFSIDKRTRISYEKKKGVKTWWKQEELPSNIFQTIRDNYFSSKPDIVITHDVPTSISKYVGRPEDLMANGFSPDLETNTQKLLQDCLDIHKPGLWIFGHYHRDWIQTIDGTDFVCVNELSTFEIR